jgi:hypothetical protein
MRAGSLLLCLFAFPVVAFADANDGQFMGYELGTGYTETSQAAERTATGNLLIVAKSPLKPADIKQVVLVATPVTRTVGYISAASWFATEGEARESARRYVELLRAKYPDWLFGREVMDESLRIVEVNFDKMPYNLKLRLGRDAHDGRDMWRFSMSLGWLPHSKEWQAWQGMSDTEQSAKKTAEREQLLEDSDVRGL